MASKIKNIKALKKSKIQYLTNLYQFTKINWYRGRLRTQDQNKSWENEFWYSYKRIRRRHNLTLRLCWWEGSMETTMAVCSSSSLLLSGTLTSINDELSRILTSETLPLSGTVTSIKVGLSSTVTSWISTFLTSLLAVGDDSSEMSWSVSVLLLYDSIH